MFVGLVVGIAVMLVCPLIPIAHFVLVPASPFIAGYWGIAFAPNADRHYALHGLLYGVSLALLVGLIAAIPAVLLTARFDDDRIQVLVWLFLAVGILYTGSLSAMGAMFRTLRDQQKAGASARETRQPAAAEDTPDPFPDREARQ